MRLSIVWKTCFVLFTILFTVDSYSNDRMHMKGRVRKRNSRKYPSFRSHRNTRPFCQFNSTIIDDSDILQSAIDKSKYIFTGKVLNIRHAPRVPNIGRKQDQHVYKIFIRRVIKGDLNDINDVQFEAPHKKNFNGATVLATRDRKPGENCEPSPRVRFSAIFLADKANYEDDEDLDNSYDDEVLPRRELRLVVDPVPLSLYHLDRINSAVKDMTYKPRQPLPEEPCEKTFCRFGATCVVGSDLRAHCQCPARCPTKREPVCSTDGRTFQNQCELSKESCERRLNIRKQHEGECKNTDPCHDVECPWGASCSALSGRAACRCPSCPARAGTPACGSDGREYAGACELARYACNEQVNVTLVYHGKCDPCEGHQCPEHQVCQLDGVRAPSCRCGEMCPLGLDPVCASDGRTYANECELRQEACRSRRQMRIIYRGKCSSGVNPCSSVQCGPGEQCWIGRTGAASCSCGPDCEPVLRPVCARDGTTHHSACHLRRAACQLGRVVHVAHDGACGKAGPCANTTCPFGGACSARSGRASCSCPACGAQLEPVCGSDGRTYANECKLRERACSMPGDHELRDSLVLLYNGTCETCDDRKCEFYGVCEMESVAKTKCVCPGNCSEVDTVSEPGDILESGQLCGTDGRTYATECHLRSAACQAQLNISVAYNGDCSLCENIVCKYGARCSAGECICPTDCQGSDDEPVCSNTMVTYGSECELQKAACLLPRHKQLHVIFYGDCKDRFAVAGPPIALSLESRTCAGGSPVRDAAGKEVDCGGGPSRQDCPAGSYCHHTATAARCCFKNETLQRKQCEESVHGCCPDMRTPAGGPAHAGCPSTCACHRLGALGGTCEPVGGQCACRPGVGGTRCDRCEPGYWGLPRIGAGHKGCIPCGCSMFGSVREDCEQMTGRCVCKPGIQGQKCTLCMNHEETLGPNGCYNAETGAMAPKSCSDIVCYFGAVCVESDGRAACQCPAASCPTDSTDPTMLVCGSDGQTYPSECHLKLQACRTQEDVVVQAFGICKGTEDITGTALPSKHYSPLQFTQQDDNNFPSKSTRHLLVPDPRNYYNNYGRGYDSARDKDSTSSLDGDKPHRGGFGPGYRPTPATVRAPPALVGDLCNDHADCLGVPNSRCDRAACVCQSGHRPAADRRECAPTNDEIATTEEPRACYSEPCMNFGTCIDLPEATFTCICDAQFTGELCQEKIPSPDHVNYIDTPSFDGRSYIRLKPLKAYHKLNIDVEFKTFSENGVILYDQQKYDGTGDFVSLAIVNGFVEFRYNLGDGVVILTSVEKIQLNEYHKVSAKRYHRDGILSVNDHEDVVGQSSGSLKALDLSEDTFVGSVPTNFSKVFDNIGSKHGFTGCIKHLRIIRHQVTKKLGKEDSAILSMQNIRECTANPCVSVPCLNGATCQSNDSEEFQYTCICSGSYTGQQCEEKIDPCGSNPCGSQEGIFCDSNTGGEFVCKCLFGGKLVTLDGINSCSYEMSNLHETFVPEFNGSSYLQLPKLDGLSDAFRIEIWFLTKKLSGMLFYNSQSSKAKGDFISLNLVNGYLQFRFNLGSGIANISCPEKVTKDRWHKVRAYRSGREGTLRLDDWPAVKGFSAPSLTELNLGQPVFLGSLPLHTKPHRLSGITSSFIGAMQQVFVNSVPLILYNDDTPRCSMALVEEILPCATVGTTRYSGYPCSHTASPCQHNGACVPMLNEYKCVCKDGFEGRNCETMLHPEITDNNTPVKFDGETYMAYRSRGGRRKLPERGMRLDIKFRTTESSGLLMWRKKGGVGHGDFLALGISDGHAELIYSDYSSRNVTSNRKDRWYSTIRSRMRVDDGLWHTVVIRRRKKMSLIQTDDQPSIRGYTQLPILTTKANPKLWIGGAPSLPHGLPLQLYQGLKGCVASLKSNGRQIDLHRPIGSVKPIEMC